MTHASALTGARSVLVVLSGLPGAGKSSVARDLAVLRNAVYLRIDTIEQALRNSPGVTWPVNEEGYRIAYALAADNLLVGSIVIADCVNAVEESRDAWRDVARQTNSSLHEVEIICSDAVLHRQRVATREANIPGLRLPTWQEVVEREYQPWNRNHIVIDTAHKTVVDCVRELNTAITLAAPG